MIQIDDHSGGSAGYWTLPTQTQQQINNSTHTLVHKDLLFSNLASDVSGVELLQLEYMKAYSNAYDKRMTEAQEQQLERRLTKLCQMD